MRKFWNWVKNEAGRTLHFDGYIAQDSWFDDDITPKKFKAELTTSTDDIAVWLNSPGGDVFAANQIYTMLKEYEGKVTVKIDGIAASAASVIAMAGDEIVMSPVAMMMIHNPATVIFGEAGDLASGIKMLTEVKESIVNAYEERTGVILNHLHPIETATAPDMVSRRGAITFTGINSGNNVILGTITYTFVTSLGSPTANNVQVKIQDTLRNTVKKLAEAIRGIQDVVNIVYGSGTSANPASTAYWTSRNFSVGDVTIPSGESLFLLERAENATAPLTLTSTATATINAFTRASYLRYVLSGNAAGGTGINSVRGPLHTLLPIGSVVIGGQGGLLYPTAYDCHLVTLCRQSDTSEKELDLYISNDEVNFTRISRSTPIGADSSNAGLHIHIQMRQSRVPSGYGLYISMGSDGTSASAFCDLKFTYHLYPVSLATTNM